MTGKRRRGGRLHRARNVSPSTGGVDALDSGSGEDNAQNQGDVGQSETL